ncbi:helix-turn-helix domain-containing protein [Microbacterium sp. NPDC055910]|uniref:AraC family transcriptional regulator n=1 Tax=Microbacterium sp. NPDC055910 TaxID=3345659 RepID=UPI0035DA16D7
MTARISQLADCLIVSGAVAAVERAATPLTARRPYALLTHVRTSRGPHADAVTAMLLTSLTPRIPAPPRAHIVALAVPLVCVTGSSLAPVTQLSETALVRASRALLESLARDLPSGEAASSRSLDDALVSLLRGILQEHPRTAAATSHEATFRARLAAVVDARHTDPRLDVVQLAHELHVSRRQLYRYADSGVAAMLALRRVHTAQKLLAAHPDLSISDIAFRAGFASPSRLRAQLLRITGETPTEYRRRSALPAESEL